MTKRVLHCALGALLAFALWGCSDDPTPTDPGHGEPVETVTCLGCHSSEENLRVALGETAPKVSIPVVTTGDG